MTAEEQKALKTKYLISKLDYWKKRLLLFYII
jgi:hypothetical protein